MKWGMWRQMKITFLSVLLVGEANIRVNKICFCLQEDDRKFAAHSGLPTVDVRESAALEI